LCANVHDAFQRYNIILENRRLTRELRDTNQHLRQLMGER
jgi:hypothetical protein